MIWTNEEDLDLIILAIKHGDYEDAIKLIEEIKEDNSL